MGRWRQADAGPLRGLKRIARELGCSHHTVKAYVVTGGVKPFKPPVRAKKLDGLDDWLFMLANGKAKHLK